ncbi:MAG: DUF3179 domain-containing protein [Planctomycetota bacterium]|nr:MAG: DUF3179 domain-containing protein [Planctomycetota bacterium]
MQGMAKTITVCTIAWLLGVGAGEPGAAARPAGDDGIDALERDFDAHARRAAPRNAFPVLDDPPMVGAERAPAFLDDRAWVIGIEIGGVAKAYPIAIMGRHELVNDHCGALPIAVSW